VLSGGTTSATTVSSGGREVISANGVASGSFVRTGGTEFRQLRGIVHGATISSGGRLVVEAGAIVQGTVTGLGIGTLELGGGTGTITGLPSTGDVTVSGPIAATIFDDFGTLKIGPRRQLQHCRFGAHRSAQARP